MNRDFVWALWLCPLLVSTSLGGIPAMAGDYPREHIYDTAVHPDDALQLWENILKSGEAFGAVPAGLGARDSTRTEAG